MSEYAYMISKAERGMGDGRDRDRAGRAMAGGSLVALAGGGGAAYGARRMRQGAGRALSAAGGLEDKAKGLSLANDPDYVRAANAANAASRDFADVDSRMRNYSPSDNGDDARKMRGIHRDSKANLDRSNRDVITRATANARAKDALNEKAGKLRGTGGVLNAKSGRLTGVSRGSLGVGAALGAGALYRSVSRRRDER